MEEDDGMMLNISSSNEIGANSRFLRVDAKKSKGSWKQKKLQKQMERAAKSSIMFPHVQKRIPPLKNKVTKDHKREKNESQIEDVKHTEEKEHSFSTHTKSSQPREKFQVISTLFRHNPEVPEVSLSEFKSPAMKKNPSLFAVESFHDLNLAPYMVSNLEENMKLTKMTNVQRLAIPLLLKGHDAFVKSQTGTGKTLSYAIPVVQTLQEIHPKIKRIDGPFALILVPTRELALQSYIVIQKLLKPLNWIVPGCITGGEKRKAEKARFRKGVNIIVATPGRLLDHIQQTQCLEFSHMRWLVLDEADRLLDMGFEKDISAILTAVNKQRNEQQQTILLSATLTDGVERLAGVSLKEPLFLDATKENDSGEMIKDESCSVDEQSAQNYSTPEKLEQYFIIVPSKLRLVTLAAFVLWKTKSCPDAKMIIFVASRDSVEFHYELFSYTFVDQYSEQAFSLLKLHGSMSQNERTKVFNDFKQTSRGVLFCTDVAARGLDLPHVNWIIQYNTPGGTEDYVHRVGRTARIGSQGQGLLFVQPSEVDYLKSLHEQGLSLKEMKLNQILCTLLDETTKVKSKGKKEHLAQQAATSLQLRFEEHVLASQDHIKLAKAAFQSFIRSYATYPASLKSIFHVKNLHLGHVAKSFALRKTPSELGHGKDRKKLIDKRVKKSSEPKKRKLSMKNEFATLRGPLVKKAKTKK